MDQAAALQAQQRRREAAERLAAEASRRARTIFIGALAKFESYFDGLWSSPGEGQRAPPGSSAEALERWEMCRTEVLNNGNAQLRALLSELESYEICRKS
jgi:hypothetical protein